MKAVLVIDVPECCGKCRLADFGKCLGSNSYIHMLINSTPKECPLRLLPQKKTPSGSDIFNDYVNGWNDCIEEITGEKNEAD